MLTYISLFSGVGGFDQGFDRAGLACLAQVEFDAKASDVLRHHWPNVPKFKDVRDVGKHNLPTPDVLCGGFPCTDVSVAGKRKGLVGEYSGLWFEFHRIITELKPRFVVIENVPGLFSSNSGKDFATILGGLTGVIPSIPDGGWKNAGFAVGYPHLYKVSWRVLDSRYLGVAQRRRRVFIVGSITDGSSAQILFEQQGGSGDTEPGFTARQGAPPSFAAGATVYRKVSHGEYANDQNSSTLAARDYKDATDLITIPVATRLNPQSADKDSDYEATTDLVAFNVTFCDTNGRRKDRLNGGLYVNETDKANTLSSSISEQTLIAGTLSASERELPVRAVPAPEADMLVVQALDVRNMTTIDELSATLQAKNNGGQSLNYINPVMVGIHASSGEDISPTLTGEGHDGSEDGRGRHAFAVSVDRIKDFVETEDRIYGVQSDAKASTAQEHVYYKPNAVVNSLDTAHVPQMIATDIVRRLTPVECERLQGFSDGHSAVNGAADSTRYKQMGNAVTVTVAEWIGQRIVATEWKRICGL